jgi:signal transduction histidine kinase
VLDNLIENAIKYTPAGTEITVEATLANGQPALAVFDNGPGIPPEDRERAFERFYRGSTGKRSGPGSGLGLAIVDELVRRWGGDVRIADGDGTKIRATFPRRLTPS